MTPAMDEQNVRKRTPYSDSLKQAGRIMAALRKVRGESIPRKDFDIYMPYLFGDRFSKDDISKTFKRLFVSHRTYQLAYDKRDLCAIDAKFVPKLDAAYDAACKAIAKLSHDIKPEEKTTKYVSMLMDWTGELKRLTSKYENGEANINDISDMLHYATKLPEWQKLAYEARANRESIRGHKILLEIPEDEPEPAYANL